MQHKAQAMMTQAKAQLKKKRTYLVGMGLVGLGVGMNWFSIETIASPDQPLEDVDVYILNQSVPSNAITSSELMSHRLEGNQERHPEITGLFYEEIQRVTQPEKLTALINKNYQLEQDYRPTNLTRPNINATVSNLLLKEDVSTQAEKMFEQAKKDGIDLVAKSGYRSYETQRDIYQRYVKNQGVAYADRISAKPGHSEHQTGLALDITSAAINYQLNTAFGQTKEGQWLQAHAHNYGFILRYPEDREADTGYSYEPWHFRYVGEDVATLLKERNWILEDYILVYER